MNQEIVPFEVTLGRRLREAREALRLTQEHVAQEVGIQRQAVSEIEHGKRSVSATELLGFSRLYGMTLDSLLAAAEASQEEELIMLRADRTGPQKLALMQFLGLCREYRALEEWLGQGRELDLRPLPKSTASFEDAWRLAAEERKRLDLGATPAWSFLETLEERVGIKVLSFVTEWSLSGASVLGRFGAGILLNSAHTEPRRIFTLAHEYFHLLVFDLQNRQTAARATVCSAEPGEKPREDILADQFAAEFLMPREAIEERLADILGAARKPTGTDIIRLAVSFGVSTQAMLFRLGNLGKLARGTPAELYSDPNLHQQDRDIRWDAEHPPVTPRRFEILAVAAYMGAHISRGKLAELLDVPLPEVDDRVAPFRAGEALSAKLRHVG